MANSTLTVGWICIQPMPLEAATAILGVARESTSAQLANVSVETHLGRIGLAKVIVVSPSMGSVPAGSACAQVQSIVAHIHRVQALVITGCVAIQSPGVRPGDLLISTSLNGASDIDTQIVQRAIDVLRGEVGEDGYWLHSNVQHGNSTAGAQDSSSALVRAPCGPHPRLHYLQDLKAMMEIAKLDEEIPCEQVSRHLLNSTSS